MPILGGKSVGSAILRGMTLDEFAEMTKEVIADEGLEGYLPTACYPDRQEMQVLEGLPEDVDREKEILGWASRELQPNEEFLVAFKLDAGSFKVIRCVGTFSEEEVYRVESR